MSIEWKILHPEDHPGPYKYELVDTAVIRLSQFFPTAKNDWVRTTGHPVPFHGFISFSRGYRWDGASGPTIDTPDTMEASLVHDGLYQLMRDGVTPLSYRKAADIEFSRLLREAGMKSWRRWYWYAAVRMAGGNRIKRDMA